MKNTSTYSNTVTLFGHEKDLLTPFLKAESWKGYRFDWISGATLFSLYIQFFFFYLFPSVRRHVYKHLDLAQR